VADLQTVLHYIRHLLRTEPIYAVGMSAGSSVLARYLGDTGQQSLISGALCISPGFAFEKSLRTIGSSVGGVMLQRMKAFFLTSNWEVLDGVSGAAEMMAATTLVEWHKHQYKVCGYESAEKYFLYEDPVHVLQHVKVPVMYINAKDVRCHTQLPKKCSVLMCATCAPQDMAFPGPSLTFGFARICEESGTSVVVQTARGGHGCFYEGLGGDSWCFTVASEWFDSIHAASWHQ
jgi:hypothetical protein